MKPKLDAADAWLRDHGKQAQQALDARREKNRAKKARKKARRGPSPCAPEKQDSQLFWQEAWKLKQALREAIRG